MLDIFIAVALGLGIFACIIFAHALIECKYFPIYTQLKNRLDPIRAAGIALELEDLRSRAANKGSLTWEQLNGQVVLGGYKYFSIRVYLKAGSIRRDIKQRERAKALDSRIQDSIREIEYRRKQLQ